MRTYVCMHVHTCKHTYRIHTYINTWINANTMDSRADFKTVSPGGPVVTEEVKQVSKETYNIDKRDLNYTHKRPGGESSRTRRKYKACAWSAWKLRVAVCVCTYTCVCVCQRFTYLAEVMTTRTAWLSSGFRVQGLGFRV